MQRHPVAKCFLSIRADFLPLHNWIIDISITKVKTIYWQRVISIRKINTERVKICQNQGLSTGHPHKRRVWLFVWNINKCMEKYWRVLYRKLKSRNGQVKAQNKCKPTSIVVCCRFCGSTWRIWAILWVLRLLLIMYSNSQRKTHQIAQIRHVESQKRQYKTTD